MSFLFVDRILRMDEGRFIQGIKQVTFSDTYLCPSFSVEEPQLMPSIIGETLGQLGAWCAMHAYQFTLRPVAGVVSAVHIHGEANVGDTILLETTIDALDETAVEYHSVATVNDKQIFSIESALGPMLPMKDFIHLATVKKQFGKIYRPGEWMTHLPSFAKGVPSVSERGIFHPNVHCQPNNIWANFDTLLDFQPGERMVATKSIHLGEPYLVDHFPRKPVLPLTLLLQAKLQLATSFLTASFEDGAEFRPATIRKIKMSGFVQPGDSVVTTLCLKEKTEREALVTYRTEMQNKRVCMAEALFLKK